MADDVSIQITLDAAEVTAGLAEVRAAIAELGAAVEGIRAPMVATAKAAKSGFEELSKAVEETGEATKKSGELAEGLFDTMKKGVDTLAQVAKEARDVAAAMLEMAKAMAEANEKAPQVDKSGTAAKKAGARKGRTKKTPASEEHEDHEDHEDHEAGEGAKKGGGLASAAMSVAKDGAALFGRVASGALAAGAAVKGVVDAGVEFAKGMGEAGEKTERTSKALGMTVADTQRLSSVFAQAGAGPESLSTAMTSLNRSTAKAASGNKETADAFKKIGVDLHTARTPAELMDATMKGLAALPGPDRAAAATQIFGDKMEVLGPISSLTKDKLEEFNKQAESSGAVMPGAVTQAAALGEAMDAGQTAMTGVNNVLADALAPSLTEIIKSMTGLINGFTQSYTSGGLVKQLMDGIGTVIHIICVVFEVLVDTMSGVWAAFTGGAQGSHDLMDRLKQIIELVGKAFVGLGELIQIVAANIRTEIDGDVAKFQTFGTVIKDVFTLNWGKIESDMKAGGDRIAQIAIQHAKTIADIKARTEKHDGEIGVEPPRAVASPDETKPNTPKQKKASHGASTGHSTTGHQLAAAPASGECAATPPPGSKSDGQASDAEASAKDLAKVKEATDQKIAEINRGLAAKNSALDEEIKATQEAVKNGEISEAQGLATIKAKIDERQRAEADAAVAISKARADADDAAMQRYKAGSKEYKDAQQDKVQAVKAGLAGIAAAEEAGNQARKKADKDFADEQKAGYEKARAEAEKFYKQIGDFARSNVEGLIKGTESWAQLFSNTLNKMLGVFLDWAESQALIALGLETKKTATAEAGAQSRKIVATAEAGAGAAMAAASTAGHVAAEATKTGATAAGTATRLATEQAGAAQSLAISAQKALADIANSAAMAAAGAYSAIARTPFVGPVLAPVAAALAFGAVLSFGKSLFSAEGGWGDVPFDNAPTFLHRNEMVLPASIAQPLRASLGAGGFTPPANQNAANDSGGDIHLHISAMDGASVHRVLTSEHGQRALRSAFDRARAGGVVSRERWS